MNLNNLKRNLDILARRGDEYMSELSEIENKIYDLIVFDGLDELTGEGSECCGKNMIESGTVYICKRCDNWEYSSS